MVQIHATCVALDACGVLLFGESGAGKSDLALRLIDGGARLVADDQVIVEAQGEVLYARPHPRTAGLLEVRGVGILTFPFTHEVALRFAVRLVAREVVERIPESTSFDCEGISLPLVCLHALNASTPAKIRAIAHQK